MRSGRLGFGDAIAPCTDLGRLSRFSLPSCISGAAFIVGSTLMLQDAATAIGIVATLLWTLTHKVFLTASGSLSIAKLFTTLVIAIVAIVWLRRPKRRSVRLLALLKTIFAKRIVFSRSAYADYGFAAFNIFMVGILFGWAIISNHYFSVWTSGVLTSCFGAASPTGIPEFWGAVIITVALFIAFEFAYWFDHYISHVVPFLWEFHKVHHQAEVLTPITNFRVHPVDTIVFYNLIALCTGLTHGLFTYVLGNEPPQLTVFDSNVIFLFFSYVLQHLHHSHVWIAFTGWFGRVIMSPAHHQIHHSTNPIHYDRNFGGNLALFDWLFGTLHMPAKENEQLTFGADPDGFDPHSITGGLIAPFVRAAGHLRPRAAQPTTALAAGSKHA